MTMMPLYPQCGVFAYAEKAYTFSIHQLPWYCSVRPR